MYIDFHLLGTAWFLLKKMVFQILLQDRNDFELSTLPALIPVLSTAAGDTLLLLVKHAELIIHKVTKDVVSL